jgi:hypothetical protein
MTEYYKSIISFYGNSENISECLSDIQSINNEEKNWEQLEIKTDDVDYLFYPIEILNQTSIQIDAARIASEELFAEICEKYKLHGILEFEVLNLIEIGEYNITPDGKRFRKSVDENELPVFEDEISESDQFDTIKEKAMREALRQKSWQKWPKFNCSREQLAELFYQQIFKPLSKLSRSNIID